MSVAPFASSLFSPRRRRKRESGDELRHALENTMAMKRQIITPSGEYKVGYIYVCQDLGKAGHSAYFLFAVGSRSL